MIVAGSFGRNFAFGRGSSIIPAGPCDPYYNNVALLLHMDGANGSTTFTDNSPVPKTVTANGGAQVNTSIVKYGTGSSYFNGINAYLSTPRSSSFIPDANEDFTMEAWVYLTATPSSQSAQIFGLHNYGNSSDYIFMIDSSLRVTLYINIGLQYFVNTATPLTLNSWYHVAVSRYGTGSNNMAIYVNGVGQSFTTNIGFAGSGSNPFTIGSDNPGTGSIFTGYIDDVRITKGVARYTGNFTPPTAAFPDSGCTDLQFVNPALVPETLNSGPIYSSLMPAPALVPQTLNSTSTIYSSFMPTPAVAPLSLSGPAATDPYYSNVVMLFHFDGSNGSTAIIDNSQYAFTGITALGGMAISTTQSKFGGASLRGTAAYDVVQIDTSNSRYYAGTGDFTIECWLYHPNATMSFERPFNMCQGDGPQLAFLADNTLNVIYKSNVSFTIPNFYTGYFDQWVHVAYVRSSGVFTIYRNGIAVGSSRNFASFSNNSNTLSYVGGFESGNNSQTWLGYIDDFRYTIGVARYTGNFTPPTAPFPNS